MTLEAAQKESSPLAENRWEAHSWPLVVHHILLCEAPEAQYGAQMTEITSKWLHSLAQRTHHGIKKSSIISPPFQSAPFVSEPINSWLISPPGSSLDQGYFRNVITAEQFSQLVVLVEDSRNRIAESLQMTIIELLVQKQTHSNEIKHKSLIILQGLAY